MTKVKKETKPTSTQDMQQAVGDMRAEIVNLTMQFSKGQLKHTTQIRTKKDELARLLTKISMERFVKSVESDKKEEAK